MAFLISVIIGLADSWEPLNDKINGGYTMRRIYHVEYVNGEPDYENKFLMDTTWYDKNGNLTKVYSEVRGTLFNFVYDSTGEKISGEHYEGIDSTGKFYDRKYIIDYRHVYSNGEIVDYLETKRIYDINDSLIEYSNEAYDTIIEGNRKTVIYYEGDNKIGLKEISKYDSIGRIVEFESIDDDSRNTFKKKYLYGLPNNTYKILINYAGEHGQSYQIFDSRHNLLEENINKGRYYSIRKCKYQTFFKSEKSKTETKYELYKKIGRFDRLWGGITNDTNDRIIENSVFEKNGDFRYTKFYDYENGAHIGSRVKLDNGRIYDLDSIYWDSSGCFVEEWYAIDNYQRYIAQKELIDSINKVWSIERYTENGELTSKKLEQYDDQGRIIKSLDTNSHGLSNNFTHTYYDNDNLEVILSSGDLYIKDSIKSDEYGNPLYKIHISNFGDGLYTSMTLYEYYR